MYDNHPISRLQCPNTSHTARKSCVSQTSKADRTRESRGQYLPSCKVFRLRLVVMVSGATALAYTVGTRCMYIQIQRLQIPTFFRVHCPDSHQGYVYVHDAYEHRERNDSLHTFMPGTRMIMIEVVEQQASNVVYE
jgi:hypothetical protein